MNLKPITCLTIPLYTIQIACKNGQSNAPAPSGAVLKDSVNLYGRTGEKIVDSNDKAFEFIDHISNTIDNMKIAYKGEIIASQKCRAFGHEAEKEGFSHIALLYKAVSISESIHAENHKSVILEAGAVVPELKPTFSVNTTQKNLEENIKADAYDVKMMYPGFISTALAANNQMAVTSLTYARETQKKHNYLFNKALIALNNGTEKGMPDVYYVCPTCGNTYPTKAPVRCAFSLTKDSEFIVVNSLK